VTVSALKFEWRPTASRAQGGKLLARIAKESRFRDDHVFEESRTEQNGIAQGEEPNWSGRFGDEVPW